MAYGAQSSGAYNDSGDGSGSGTGRADRMLQFHSEFGDFATTIQYQYRQLSPSDIQSNYRYGTGASIIYKGWKDIGLQLGAAFSYAKFSEITEGMRSIGIDGSDQSYIMGFSFKRDNYLINANLSYSKNHMNDNLGIYFDSVEAEIYLHYDLGNTIRIAGGLNWLLPRDSDYHGDFRISKEILSLQYTFGKHTFDDLIYLEVALPHGRTASGEKSETSIALGLRYLFGW